MAESMVRLQLDERKWAKVAAILATRYEKTLRNYVAVVAIGCALLWLRL